MQLTRFTDYALRTLVFLSLRDREQLSSITEVSETFDLSRNHIVKVVHQLGLKGYVQTIRGKNGGIRLGAEPEQISLGAVVRDMENNLKPLSFEAEEGPLVEVGKISVAADKAMEAFLGVLDQYTIADMLDNQELKDSVLDPFRVSAA